MATQTFESLAALQARLTDVESAIQAARGGSSYSIGGRSVTRQDLDSLNIERDRLRREIKQTNAVLEGARSPGEAVAVWD